MIEEQIRKEFHRYGDRCYLRRGDYDVTLVQLDRDHIALQIIYNGLMVYGWAVGSLDFVVGVIKWADMGGNWKGVSND